jgi:hypothetical protein
MGMITTSCLQPDLLRRFVATPYVFSNNGGGVQRSVQSNDLEIALSVRQLYTKRYSGSLPHVVLWRIIRDTAPADKEPQLFTITDGCLRTLHLGMRTVLVHDRERAEVLGFLSAGVETQDLVSSLIPLLLRSNGRDRS